MTKMKLALVICGCLIGGVAAAAPKWDANGDGTVDAQEKAERHAEMKAKRDEMKQKMLLKFDTNKDGKLDQGERVAMKDTLATEAFKRLDTDGNGSLSLAEFKQGKKFGGHFGGHHMRRGHNKVR
jgi:Ca2+-binding EF-hand superfamily protein